MEHYPVASSLITYWNVAVNAANDAVLESAGVNITQYRALSLISDLAGKASTSDVATKLALSRSQAGKTVAQLIELNAVQKTSDYAAHLRITAKGAKMLAAGGSSAAMAMMNLMLPAKPLFDKVTLLSHSWITAGLKSSSTLQTALFANGIDIGDAIRLGLEGAVRAERELARLCRKESITNLEYRMLLAIKENDKGMRATDLASVLLAKLPNISTASRHLHAQRLIEYAQEQDDPRSTLLCITQAGSSLCERVTDAFNDTLMTIGGGDDPKIREAYIEISRICVNSERERRLSS